jgi:hypothetical protein
MKRTSLLAFVALVVGCGGAVAPVDDSSNSPAPAPTTTTRPPVTDAPSPTPSPTTSSPTNGGPVPVPAIVASSYDGSCNADADCVLITEIADCGCACPNAAINRRDLPKAEHDETVRQAACRQNDAPGCGVMCSNSAVYCDTTSGLVGACRYRPIAM